MKLFGDNLGRKALLKKTGSTDQAFGIRRLEYRGGDANLITAYEVATGSGLEFSVNENKCLDIYSMKHKGVNLGFLSKAGLHSSYNADHRSDFFRYSQGCGMLYTCGLTNVGGGYENVADAQYPHGMIRNKAAEDVCARVELCGEGYEMVVSGRMREAAFFGRNLSMTRSIRTSAGSNSVLLRDVIENLDFKPDELMLLYHLNLGYPLLDAGNEFLLPMRSIEALGDFAQSQIEEYAKVTEPVDNEDECVYVMTPKCDAQGKSAACMVNGRLGLAVYVKYDVAALPYFVEWKSMRSGDYAFGMLPSSCKPIGRLNARKDGCLKVLEPFEPWTVELEIGILDTPEEIQGFKEYLNAMK